MKTDPPNQLLDPVLGLDEMEKLRQATLEAGLTGLRRRRARRQVVRVCAVACLFVLPVCTIHFYRGDSATRNAGSVAAPASNTVVANRVQEGGTKIITDEELFSLFPGRPLALVGTPGHQQLVFLDKDASSKRYLTQ